MADAPTPFFAWAHFMDVHWPYYREEALTEPDEIARAWQDLGNMHGANWNGRATTEAQRARYLAQYERAVEYTDAQIGRLLDFLEASGQLDDTIVVVTSDHGEEFLERRHWGHFEVNLYDEIVKVPLIVRLPQASRPATIRQQVRLLDVMPTILDLTDCAPPAGLEGISMRPLWDGRESDYPAEIAISEMWRDHRHMVAVRTEAYKYIWDSRKPEQRELYDLHTDPDERENLCASRPDLAGRFQAEVDAHLRRVAALTSPSGPDVEPVLDEQVIRRLRDLGYVE